MHGTKAMATRHDGQETAIGELMRLYRSRNHWHEDYLDAQCDVFSIAFEQIVELGTPVRAALFWAHRMVRQGRIFTHSASDIAHPNPRTKATRPRRHGLGVEHFAIVRTTPADQAIVSLDCKEWLRTLSKKLRIVARLMLRGLGQTAMARRLGCSQQNVGLLIRRVRDSFLRFHSQSAG